MQRIDPRIIRQIFALLLIFLIGGMIFWEMVPYLSGVLGAVTVYVLFRKWMILLIDKGWNPNLAAVVIMIISFVGVLLPVGAIVFMLGNKIGHAVDQSENVVEAVKHQLFVLEKTIDYEVSSKIDPAAISSWIAENLQGFAGGTFNMLISLGIMYFLLFYMLTNHKELRLSLFDYIPIGRKNLTVIGEEVQKMVRSNALGIPMVAIAQGLVAFIGFLIFGVKNPAFWFIIVAVGSMIPFVGTFVGIIPVFILALSEGNEFQAWGVLLYGIIVVGTTDNFIRLYILKRLDNVHPLITMIGVIIGVPLFGFIGLIFGPLLISLFMIVVRIYKQEYASDLTDGED